MTEDQRLWAMLCDNLIERHELPERLWPRRPRPKRKRMPSIARIARQANKVGAAIEIKPDGSIVVMPRPTDDISLSHEREI